MKNENQIRELILNIANRAVKQLNLKSQFSFVVENNLERFKSSDDACVTNGENIFINAEWLNKVLSDNDETQLRLYIYHEIRHLYQLSEYHKLYSDGSNIEKEELINQWNDEFNNYISHSKENAIQYFNQSTEIDANAFAIVMLNKDKNDGFNVSLDLTNFPEETFDLIHNRAKEILKLNFK